MSAALQNMLQSHAMLSTNRSEQQQISSPAIFTHMSNTTEDDQRPKQLSKFFDESKDIKSTSRRSSNSLPSQQSSEFSSYGVDWSDRAESTSHCWLPYLSKNSFASRLCTYISCENKQSTSASPLVRCASCSLSVHVAHLSELQEATTSSHHVIPPCRPSFMDSNKTDDVGMHDLHYWSHVPALSQPCTHCKRKSLKSTLHDDGKRVSIKPKVDDGAASDSATTYVAENENPKLNEPSGGLVCLWCSRNYHRRCWEIIKNDEDNSKCDYGTFGDIVVRPQWLGRVSGSRFGFRAQMPDNLKMNDRPPTPVIFFINKLSGGQKGQQIYRMLLRILNPRQVFLLENDSTIMQALDIYGSLTNARICICGGDGTVGWVLSRLADAFPSLENPPASICPLGTGNDLSRVLGWGYQYEPRRLLRTVTQIPHARPMALDRWRIQIEPSETSAFSNESVNTRRRFFSFMDPPKFIRDANQPMYENYRTPIRPYFFNYISFGLDAAVVLDFHVRRTRDSSRYTSPLKNKILYINEGRKYFNEFTFGMAWDLSSYIRLTCDGQDLTDSIRHCHSLVVLNTRSFGSGTRPWGRTPTNHFEAQDYGDRRIEVLGLNTRQMAFIHLGLRGRRIAQCSQLRIELSHPMPVHMDGEPFYLAGSTAVNITHAGQVMVLSNENS